MVLRVAAGTKRQVEDILRLRRARSGAFGTGLFSDPAWDILLYLFAARLRGETSRLADMVTDVPESTLARWAVVLEERGLICSGGDAGPMMARIALTPAGELRMAKLLATLHPSDPLA